MRALPGIHGSTISGCRVFHFLNTTTPVNNDTPHQGVDQPLAYAQAYSEQASQAAHLPGSCPIDR